MGSYFCVAYLVKDRDWDTQSSFLMPFALLLIVMALNLAWSRDMRTVERWPNVKLSNWWIFGSAVAAAYLASFLPESLLEATVLTTMLSVVLWLAVVQLTRSLLRERTQIRIARACRLQEDDPIAKELANNTDLANAVVVSVFAAVEIWLLASSEWAPELSTGGHARLRSSLDGSSASRILFCARTNRTSGN